jgi:hypothetical protein
VLLAHPDKSSAENSTRIEYVFILCMVLSQDVYSLEKRQENFLPEKFAPLYMFYNYCKQKLTAGF